MRRKTTSVLLTLAMSIALVACANTDKNSVIQNAEETVSEVENDRTEESVTDAESEKVEEEQDTDVLPEENVDETAGESVEENIEKKIEENTEETAKTKIIIQDVIAGKFELPESEALDFVKDMKIGWNLGNTFDAFEASNKENELDFETAWVNIKTTGEMIDAIKAAGFNTVRIPVSWHNHVSDDGTYTISDVWMNRVQEVVDYAYEQDMYVIINVHHDNNKKYFYPTQEYLEQSKSYLKAVWTQIGTRFADYDDHLVMEGMNEPRLVDTQYEWWMDLKNEQCIEAIRCINELNQLFVDTVRSTGGNNATRYLLIPGYDASLQGVQNDYFALPKDSAENQNRILVEIHAYIPYNFALQSMKESGSTDKFSVFDSQAKYTINELMNGLYDKFTSQGIGVVLDEFGSVNKNDNLQARVDHATMMVANARARGITCCWWDNNLFSGDGELFGIFDRATCTFPNPEIVDALMKYAE